MSIPINLASHPFVNYRRFLLSVGLLGAAALALTVWVGVQGATAWQDSTTVGAQIRELEGRRADLSGEQERLEAELRAPTSWAMLGRAQFLNQLIQQKTLSWTELFSDLQARLPNRVRILSLSPSLRTDGRLQIELQVGGDSTSAVIEFLRALEQDPKFREVVPHSQSRASGSTEDAVLARVTAVYAQE